MKLPTPMPESTCEELGIPLRLRRENRDIIPQFDDESECLYRWFKPGLQYSPDGRLSAATVGPVFSPPYDISCNRSSLCASPADVLYSISKLPHRFDHGVIEAQVISVQVHIFEVQQGSERLQVSLQLGIEHKPEECMYPHSQIIVHKNGERIADEVRPNKMLKTAIRDELARIFTVCHAPNGAFTP